MINIISYHTWGWYRYSKLLSRLILYRSSHRAERFACSWMMISVRKQSKFVTATKSKQILSCVDPIIVNILSYIFYSLCQYEKHCFKSYIEHILLSIFWKKNDAQRNNPQCTCRGYLGPLKVPERVAFLKVIFSMSSSSVKSLCRSLLTGISDNGYILKGLSSPISDILWNKERNFVYHQIFNAY